MTHWARRVAFAPELDLQPHSSIELDAEPPVILPMASHAGSTGTVIVP